MTLQMLRTLGAVTGPVCLVLLFCFWLLMRRRWPVSFWSLGGLWLAAWPVAQP